MRTACASARISTPWSIASGRCVTQRRRLGVDLAALQAEAAVDAVRPVAERAVGDADRARPASRCRAAGALARDARPAPETGCGGVRVAVRIAPRPVLAGDRAARARRARSAAGAPRRRSASPRRRRRGVRVREVGRMEARRVAGVVHHRAADAVPGVVLAELDRVLAADDPLGRPVELVRPASSETQSRSGSQNGPDSRIDDPPAAGARAAARAPSRPRRRRRSPGRPRRRRRSGACGPRPAAARRWTSSRIAESLSRGTARALAGPCAARPAPGGARRHRIERRTPRRASSGSRAVDAEAHVPARVARAAEADLVPGPRVGVEGRQDRAHHDHRTPSRRPARPRRRRPARPRRSASTSSRRASSPAAGEAHPLPARARRGRAARQPPRVAVVGHAGVLVAVELAGGELVVDASSTGIRGSCVLREDRVAEGAQAVGASAAVKKRSGRHVADAASDDRAGDVVPVRRRAPARRSPGSARSSAASCRGAGGAAAGGRRVAGRMAGARDPERSSPALTPRDAASRPDPADHRQRPGCEHRRPHHQVVGRPAAARRACGQAPRRWKRLPPARRAGRAPTTAGSTVVAARSETTPATPATTSAGDRTTGLHIQRLPNEPP